MAAKGNRRRIQQLEVTYFSNFFKMHVQLSPLKFRNARRVARSDGFDVRRTLCGEEFDDYL
jgi:hypothetical protein